MIVLEVSLAIEYKGGDPTHFDGRSGQSCNLFTSDVSTWIYAKTSYLPSIFNLFHPVIVKCVNQP